MDLLYSETPQAVIEGHAVAAVAIANEKSRWPPIPGTAFDNLLGRPFGRRVACHADVQDFSIGVPNHEEDIERLEQNRLNAEKIAGPIYSMHDALGTFASLERVPERNANAYTWLRFLPIA